MDFFSNETVISKARCCSARSPTTYLDASQRAFSYHLPAPRGKNDRYVGMIRGPSPRRNSRSNSFAQRTSTHSATRATGVLSTKSLQAQPSGRAAPLELLGLDFWYDFAGMTEHYNDETHCPGWVALFWSAATNGLGTGTWTVVGVVSRTIIAVGQGLRPAQAGQRHRSTPIFDPRPSHFF